MRPLESLPFKVTLHHYKIVCLDGLWPYCTKKLIPWKTTTSFSRTIPPTKFSLGRSFLRNPICWRSRDFSTWRLVSLKRSPNYKFTEYKINGKLLEVTTFNKVYELQTLCHEDLIYRPVSISPIIFIPYFPKSKI